MIKNIAKLYALSLAIFLHLSPSFAMMERFGPTNFEINFNDQPIKQIRYRSGAWLDYLELFTYKNNEYVSLGYAGDPTTKAGVKEILLDQDEVLIGISGEAGTLLDSLTFLTNRKRIEVFTGWFSWTSRSFNYSRPSDDQHMFSIFGRTTTHLGYNIVSEIGVAFRKAIPLINENPGKFD